MSRRRLVVTSLILAALAPWRSLLAADLTAPAVMEAIQRGRQYLVSKQERNGTWRVDDVGNTQHKDGVAALGVLALLTSGLPPTDPNVQRSLKYLRSLTRDKPDNNYDMALVIMALAAAKEPGRSDSVQISVLADRLATGQISRGNVGAWDYTASGQGRGDPSNSQFVILGLREAAESGAQIDRDVWLRAKTYWETIQNADGGWSYAGGTSTGSMTVAGIASMSIIQQMLRDDSGVGPDGTPPCCREEDPFPALDRGIRWLGTNFAVGHNPGGNNWILYHIYGIERAGRLSGRRFFGEHDWYREGAAFLLATQLPEGYWVGDGIFENKPIVGSCLALLFLSKGLSPVLMSKLQHGPRDPTRPAEIVSKDWNKHPRDVRNLMEHISGLPRWPGLLTSQEVDLLKATQTGGVDVLLQAPMLYLTGESKLQFTAAERELLKEYLIQGGFILAAPSCRGAEFETSFRELLLLMLPPGEGELKPLPAEHPVYRSEYLLSPEVAEIHGVDVGCRTAVMFVPEDLSCLWSYWQRHDPPKRNPKFKARIVRTMQIGVNIAAYATGREPPQSLDAPRKAPGEGQLDEIERGLLQVAQLRHSGQWNAAPRALRNLLLALNETVGLAATTKPKDLPASDPSLFQYPLLYMHGRTRFQIAKDEREAIKLHLSRGGVLFADACCGAPQFDKSFRELVAQLYPDEKFAPIPITHEMFSEKIGRDVRRLRRRSTEGHNPNAPLASTVREVEPYLEGIEIDGRYAIIYSKYDISCALEKQSTLSCEGYLPEDAVKLATNIVLYSMLQDVSLAPAEK